MARKLSRLVSTYLTVGEAKRLAAIARRETEARGGRVTVAQLIREALADLLRPDVVAPESSGADVVERQVA